MNPTSPGAYARRLAAAIDTSRAPNCAAVEQRREQRPGEHGEADRRGTRDHEHELSAQSSVAEKRSGDDVACCSESRGRITVPSATPNTPSGNSMSRSE